MKELTIALVAHDARKTDMVDWVVYNMDYLSQHKLVCTGTTGTLVEEALSSHGLHPKIEKKNSGPLGGDTEIAAMVVKKEIDLAVFLIDDLTAQAHEADIQMLLRQCRVHNIPIACNRYSADLMITSTLWDDEEYVPTPPIYKPFDRHAFEQKLKRAEREKLAEE